MDKSVWIQLPRTIRVGNNTINDTVDALNDIPLPGNPLIVTTKTPHELVTDTLHTQLQNDGRTPNTHLITEASFNAVQNVIQTAEETDADFLIGIGGGKPIDVAKAASGTLNIGFISIPTAASHDGIVSGRSSIPDGNTRHSVSADPPLAVIADTSLLSHAPWELTTAGYADIISNYTAVKDWGLANRLTHEPYSEYAATLAKMTAELLVSNRDSIHPGHEYSTWFVMKALISSGVAMSIAGTSRPASGAEHMFSHQLDRLEPDTALHGHQVGVGTILTAYLHGDTNQWRELQDALESVGAPTTATELNHTDETIIEALTTAHEIRDRYTILGENGVSEDAAIEACVETGVIN